MKNKEKKYVQNKSRRITLAEKMLQDAAIHTYIIHTIEAKRLK